MEEDLNILKVEYLNNHLLDNTKILNLCKDDQTIIYKCLQWDNLKEDLKILKVEYLSNHLLDDKTTSGQKMTSMRAECDLWVLR